jgi:pyridoxine 5-phosphate synthase
MRKQVKKKLGVNIDHVATLRQARKGMYPDPVEAAIICEQAGADSIVAHLREDRRHIHDRDVIDLRKRLTGRFNVEMSLDPEVINVVARVSPDQITLVPERREELTTEGGLDVIQNRERIAALHDLMKKKGVVVSLFVDPVREQIDQTLELGIGMIELHTGSYANASSSSAMERELVKIREMTVYAHSLGLIVNVGHGLNYQNTGLLADVNDIVEFNIGHAIISRAIVVGLENAVREMVLILGGR